jgi:hypothetical protein
VNKRYLLKTHKFGIMVPMTVAEALDLDKNRGTTHWQEAINLEAKNVEVAFQDLDDSEQVPVGYQMINAS